jgi:hypothetical protein
MSQAPANVTNTTGTYNFAPGMGETVLYSYGIAGVKRTALTQQHFEDARMASGMIMGRWGSDGVNLWSVDLQTIQLVQGQATYQVPANTVVMLDMYYTISSGTAQIDRIMLPVSRTEYASYPNKQQQGAPTVAWFDRLLSPTVTLWPVPNGQQAYFKYYRLRQTQDSNLANNANVEIPWYYLEAYAFALAYRLALIWNPDRAISLKPQADESYGIARNQNTETANFYVSPVINGYWRQ